MLPPVPVYNSSNESLFYTNGQLIAVSGKNNFYLPVSKADYGVMSVLLSLIIFKLITELICLSAFLIPVFNLQLRLGPYLLLSVPEDKLRAENDDYVNSRSCLQHHHSANACHPAG